MAKSDISKETIIRFFRGEASEQEVDKLILWVEASKENRDYFAKEKAIWTVLSSKMDTEKDLEEEDVELGQLLGRIEAQEKQTKNQGVLSRNIFRWTYAVSAAVILALLILDINTKRNPSLLQPDSVAELLEREPEDKVMSDKAIQDTSSTYSLYTEKGVKASLVLPDGSKVWLNSDTRIEYPSVFTGPKRLVKLSGEAYFEVVSNEKMPMQISTSQGFDIEVKGTKLSVKCYENDNQFRTTLYSGKIELNYQSEKTGIKTNIELNPSESFILRKDLPPVLLRQDDVDQQIGWKSGKLIFSDTPMSEVLKMLERWHGAKFLIRDDSIYQYRISATFESESLVQIVDILQLMIPLRMDVDKNVVTIY